MKRKIMYLLFLVLSLGLVGYAVSRSAPTARDSISMAGIDKQHPSPTPHPTPHPTPMPQPAPRCKIEEISPFSSETFTQPAVDGCTLATYAQACRRAAATLRFRCQAECGEQGKESDPDTRCKGETSGVNRPAFDRALHCSTPPFPHFERPNMHGHGQVLVHVPMMRDISVYVKRQGRWQAVASRAIHIAQQQ